MAFIPVFRQCPAGSASYIIMPGDTISAIAKRLGTTTANIMLVNPGLNPSTLRIGQQICVPRIQTQTSACPIGTSPYEIKSEDTLSAIAKRFNTTTEAIVNANPGIDPGKLKIGQKICITENPAQITPCPLLNTYVVQEGDILSGIAKTFNTTINDILALNPRLNPNAVYKGLVICLPVTPPQSNISVYIRTKRLTLYRYGKVAKTYPVATGKPETPSPLGTFTIVNKQLNPGGPFGTRWMGLSEPHYGIHGTNNPSSIGQAASNGCIRMHNKDVEELFNLVSIRTPVTIF